MNLRFQQFFLSLLFCASVAGQTDKSLISIPLNKEEIVLNKLESMRLPVYYISDENLISEADDELIGKLESLGVDVKVLSDEAASSKYFLHSVKNNVGDIKLTGNEVLFRDKNSIIIKADDADNIRELNFVQLRKTPYFFTNQKILNSIQSIAGNDSLIKLIVAEVNPDSVRSYIQHLQDFGTRYLYASNRGKVAEWIMNKFISIGYNDVKLDSFYQGNIWNKNVVATLPASSSSGYEVVVGGHHDAITNVNPMEKAPGADDNASGTAAVLEIARVLKKMNFVPDVKINFMTFAAEEAGLWGSWYYAERAASDSKKIKFMINHDMISTNPGSVPGSTVSINYYTGAEDFREVAKQCTKKFTQLKASNGSPNSGGSDSYPFWANGYPAVYFEENVFSPVYHTEQDLISNCNIEYCSEIIKASCATLLSALAMPSKVEAFNIVDLGDGKSLRLSWAKNEESDLAGYKIYTGRSTGVYDSSVQVYAQFLNYTVKNLTEKRKYFLGISAIDIEGNESLIVEKTFTPQSIPLAPVSLTDNPLLHSVRLVWAANKENDLLGYNIYRVDLESGQQVKLNANVITDTVFTDNTTQDRSYYNYYIKAVDSTLNESVAAVVKSRAVSLNSGIVVVDETANGNGAQLKPTDEQVDEFYNSLLQDYSKDDFDIIEAGNIKLADFGIYSTIIWHGNDNSELSYPFSTAEDIKQYLKLGGNFLYAGYLPTKAFEQNVVYPANFTETSFINEVLKIGSAEKVFGSKFYGAIGTDNYNNIFADTTKTKQTMNYHISDIESIYPTAEGKTIYYFDTKFDSTTVSGSMKGKPVGVEYIGSDYKAITLSFPLYYMDSDQAKTFLNYVLTNKFNELTDVEDKNDEKVPQQFYLSQNYPNPFNPTTTIEYTIPTSPFNPSPYQGEGNRERLITLKVFDILGREVATLVNEEKPAGNYKVVFSAKGGSASGGNAANLPSGVYFYRLTAGNLVETKSMMLLK
ncbi:MAG: M20/M25/M40 family metallo-hydrolase [Ignavibacteriales bacterium]|nr:MAG: M20/M25/M40 family metallo-hydrolase [Ignavibacteriales bacterium]